MLSAERKWFDFFIILCRFSRRSYSSIRSTSIVTCKIFLPSVSRFSISIYVNECNSTHDSSISFVSTSNRMCAGFFYCWLIPCKMHWVIWRWAFDKSILISQLNTIDSQVEQRRGLTFGSGSGYRLILRHVSEYGWTNSKVTKYRLVLRTKKHTSISHQVTDVFFIKIDCFFHRTDFENNRIIYSQDFPEKSLNGEYEFKGLIFGRPYVTKGIWNMTLYDYA